MEVVALHLIFFFFFRICLTIDLVTFIFFSLPNSLFIFILLFFLFSHCTARGSSYPYMYILQLHFFPHPFFCCNMSI